MTNALYRLGRSAAQHRRIVISLWTIGVLALVLVGRLWGGSPVDDFRTPGVESQKAVDLLAERFPDRAGATATVVFHTPDGTVTDPVAAKAIKATVADLRQLDHVSSVTDPLAGPRSIAPDGATAFAAVQYDAPAADLGKRTYDALRDVAPSDAAHGLQVEFGGELPTVFKERSEGPGEIIGMLAALVVLFVAFRAVAAMVLPLGLAVVGLAGGLSIVTLLAGWIAIPSIAPRLGTMIGLGVGIDYALFVVSRHRDQLAQGMGLDESIAQTNATAGHAVVVAGGTVVVAILGLGFAGIPFVAALGYSASIVVAVAVVAAITLLPALLGAVGVRVLPRADRPTPGPNATQTRRFPPRLSATSHPATRTPAEGVPLRAGTPGAAGRIGNGTGDRRAPEAVETPDDAPGRDRWMRWAHWVAFRPWRSAIAATALLVVLALPLFGMRLGQADAGTDPASTTQRRAYDLLAAGFGAGFNGPLLVSVDLGDRPDPGVLQRLHDAIANDPDVRAVSPPELNPAGDTGLVTVIPKSKPQDQATSDLVHRLRGDILPTATGASGATAYVGGPTAGFIDQSERIAARLPWFIAGVVTMAFVLLMVVFRSILVPLKAALLNLLSIGAAYGVVVAVFQWGWGRSLIGLDAAVPIASFVPMMMFAILFGLSMDYEVFILSRIREEYVGGHSNIDSVVVGLGATAKVITAAALIMVSVFGGFVGSAEPVVKMMGVGLATAVAVDATVVRMVLVPATMALLGDANWWFPRRLARLLPRRDHDGIPQPETT